MKHLLTLLLTVGICFSLLAQNKTITQVEYFIDDTDQGYGNNTLLDIPDGMDITDSLIVPLSNVSPGFHQLFIRAKNADNKWSQTYARTFYVSDHINGGEDIVATEYFIDTDLGFGKNTRIAKTDATTDSLLFEVSLSNVGVGFHTLYLRSQNRNGDWGPAIAKTFFVDNKKRPANITRLDYYYVGTAGTPAASSVYTYQIPRPNIDYDSTFMANAEGLVPGQTYRLYVYATNENGERSLLNSTEFTFKVCENVPVPTVTIKSGTQGVSATLVLTTTVPGNPAGVTYQWLLNGEPIEGATSQDYQVEASDFGSGGANYGVRITLPDGCIATSQNLMVTSLEEGMVNGSLQVYPNPAQDLITVDYTSLHSPKAVRGVVHDVLGRAVVAQLLQRQSDGSWKTTISTANYQPGTYILRIETGDRVHVHFFVKQ